MTQQPGSSGTRPTRPETARAAAARARWAEEQANFVALKNAKLRGELIDASVVREEWISVMLRVRAAMLALPARLASLIPKLDRADLEIIDREVRKSLIALADDNEVHDPPSPSLSRTDPRL